MIRVATPEDAEAVAAIYAPIVEHTRLCFEYAAPSVDEMRQRIVDTLQSLPWLVSEDDAGRVDGYVYASPHKSRAAYRWSVDTSVYVRDGVRGRGVGKGLYLALFQQLGELGYFQAFAGVALPNPASVALHQAVGFEPVGVHREVGFKHGTWIDVALWQRRLRSREFPAGCPPAAPRTFSAGAFLPR